MKLKLIGCKALDKELFLAAARSPHEVEVCILTHKELKEQLSQRLCEGTNADYIVLGCGICAAADAKTGETPVVLPEIHDCAALLLGSAGRYRRAFAESEDTPAWIAPIGCHGLNPAYGQPCAVISRLRTRVELPAGGREYAAELSLIMELLCGDWDERFLIIPKNSVIRMSYGRELAEAESK